MDCNSAIIFQYPVVGFEITRLRHLFLEENWKQITSFPGTVLTSLLSLWRRSTLCFMFSVSCLTCNEHRERSTLQKADLSSSHLHHRCNRLTLLMWTDARGHRYKHILHHILTNNPDSWDSPFEGFSVYSNLFGAVVSASAPNPPDSPGAVLHPPHATRL